MVLVCSRCNSNNCVGGVDYMQFLIRHITDSTGHTFTEVIKPRENERYEIVSAESKEEAEEKVELMNRITDKDKEAIGKLMKLQRILS